MLQSFPSSLKEKGKLSATELREWTYEVKGLNPVHRLADRFLRQHLNLALPL